MPAEYEVTRPIIGIENRTAQEVFEIMCDRFRTSFPLIAAQAHNATVEQCAEVADNYPKRDPGEDGSAYWAADEIAAAIRSLKEE